MMPDGFDCSSREGRLMPMPRYLAQQGLRVRDRAVSPPGDISVRPYQGEIAIVKVARIDIGHIQNLKRYVQVSSCLDYR